MRDDDGKLLQLLDYGSTLENEYGHSDEYREALDSAWELIGVRNPKSGRQAWLFGQECRIKVAENVNSAMLECLGYPKISGLERLVRSVGVCVEELLDKDGTGAFFQVEFE